MLVVNRFVLDAEDAATFPDRARDALACLAARPGYLRGELGRAYDDPAHWILTTEWESVGAYRRALGAFDVRVRATGLLAAALDEPSAYETLARAVSGGAVIASASDRAGDRPTGDGGFGD